MNREKILNAITSAIDHLENSVKLFSNENEKEILEMVWQASSDVEYSLFLLSLLPSSDAESLSVKRKSFSKLMDIRSILNSSLNMLKETKSNIENGDVARGYEKAWQARSYMLKAQEIFEKKQRENKKQASTGS
ncbi:MAG: hypothetical protein PVF15_01560 [Candidatus Bathyarchaeota archaeon]|jgi:hypothetical protein